MNFTFYTFEVNPNEISTIHPPKQLIANEKPLWHMRYLYGYPYKQLNDANVPTTIHRFDAEDFDALIASLWQQHYRPDLMAVQLPSGKVHLADIVEVWPDGQHQSCVEYEQNTGYRIYAMHFHLYTHDDQPLTIFADGKTKCENTTAPKLQYLWPHIVEPYYQAIDDDMIF